MKVLHINCNYLTTVLHQTMVEHLDGQGVESRVFAPTYDRSRAVIKPRDNVVVAQCFKKWDRAVFDYKQRKILRAVQESCNVADFNCIHAYTLYTDGNCAMNLSKKFGIPYVVAVRSTDVNAFFKYRPHLRGRGVRVMQKASAVFFLSKTYMDQVLGKYVPAHLREEIARKSYVVPNGIDDFWLENACVNGNVSETAERLARKELRVIYAGRINRNKNIRTTLKALEELRAKGWKTELTVVGKVEEPSEFELIEKDAHTRYVQAVPKEELIRLYRANDMFVMPSFTETFGLVYAEAMSQGLPVVYTKGQGFDGQFAEGEVGYHVKADDAHEVAEAIERIAENYAGLAGRVVSAAGNFRWSDIVEKYSGIYKDSANG